MGTYKVIQDIEAEDKLLGPLTLRQFIYAAIVIVMGFIAFKLAVAKWFLALPFLPPIVFFGMLAAPFGHDQSNEVWLLAKIRFSLKPRRRIWDQSGPKQLVTVTAPKRIDRQYTNGLTQDEVQSRLNALANTIDSRGWAVKNVNVNLFSQPSYVLDQVDSDRLISPDTIPEEVTSYSTSGLPDVLDEHNPTLQLLDQMMTSSAQIHHDQVVQHMQPSAQPAGRTLASQPPTDYWFMHQAEPSSIAPGNVAFAATPPTMPMPADTRIQPAQQADGRLDVQHLKNIEPLPTKTKSNQLFTADNELFGVSDQIGAHDQSQHSRPQAAQKQAAVSTVAPPMSAVQPPTGSQPTKTQVQAAVDQPTMPPVTKVAPAIANLATSNDLDVATIARQANKSTQSSGDEVVISLR